MSDRDPGRPSWIWCDEHGGGRNVFAWFRRRIDLAALPPAAVIHLFADARWRLRIDGRVVAYGPSRFVPGFPEFDSIDLLPWLHLGRNLILIEVWSPDCSTFQTMPESSGGFIAWGAIAAGGATHDLATPGAWQVQRSAAWNADAPAYSFAQGPVEMLDCARLPAGGWLSADEAGWSVPVVRRNAPWGELAARSIPALSTEVIPAARLDLVATLDSGERRLSCARRRPPGSAGKSRFPYAVNLRSPREQRVRIGLFWGPHWLNGEPLRMEAEATLGNRQNADVQLRAGDNLLYGEPEVLQEIWAQYIAIPVSAGLACGPLRAGMVLSEGDLTARRRTPPAGEADLAAMAVDWREEPATPVAGTIPARDLAWDRPGRVISADGSARLPLRLDASGSGWVVVADMGDEFLGHVLLSIDAPAGTVIDIASDERRRADGLLSLYATNPFVDGADRVILAGGRCEVELFHPRGGRWIQIAIRPAAADAEVVIHDLGVRRHQVPVARDGSFSCSDADFTWTWEASYRTLQACVEDAFVDCPWRERGTYLGDALVEAATLAAFDRDPALARRCLRLWAQGQMPNGQMQDSAPSWHRQPLGDFSLIWILLLHQLWSRDGDLGDARRWWPAVPRILNSLHYHAGPDGLWDAPSGLFLDWGVDPTDRTGSANACLNALRLRALECAGVLAQALGHDDEAAELTRQRTALLAAFRRLLWLPQAGRFARRIVDGRADTSGEAVHANTLVLAFGLAGPDQQSGVLAHVEAALARNVAVAMDSNAQGYLELYFLAYAIEGLYRYGRAATAEQVMRSHWGAMRSRGAWTIWECLRRGARNEGSLCHAWSTTPARWFHERILGVRPLQAGQPGIMLVAPDSELASAEGVVPHPAGLIRVAWKRVDGRLAITASGPPGVQLRILDGSSRVTSTAAAT